MYSSGTVHYVRDGENVLIETDANLITQAHYTDYPGMWGGLASERRGDVSSFYGFDQQANARILVSPFGVVTDSYLYKAFGEEVAVSGATVNSLRFGGEVGYWRDEAERLDVRRRELRVDQGRWMSRDPIGFGGGDWNLYKYVGNGPVSWIDPGGMQKFISGPHPIGLPNFGSNSGYNSDPIIIGHPSSLKHDERCRSMYSKLIKRMGFYASDCYGPYRKDQSGLIGGYLNSEYKRIMKLYNIYKYYCPNFARSIKYSITFWLFPIPPSGCPSLRLPTRSITVAPTESEYQNSLCSLTIYSDIFKPCIYKGAVELSYGGEEAQKECGNCCDDTFSGDVLRDASYLNQLCKLACYDAYQGYYGDEDMFKSLEWSI